MNPKQARSAQSPEKKTITVATMPVRAALGTPFPKRQRGALLHGVKARALELRESAWLPIVGKMSGFGALLLFVAWLGQHGLEEEIYGQPLALGQVDKGASKEHSATEESEAHSSEHEHAPTSETLLGQSGPANTSPSPASATATTLPAPCGKDATTGRAGITPDGLVILNVASAQELTTLTGVGPARAEAILALRERLGGFRKIADLLRVKGIGWKTLETLKKKVILDPPSESEPSATPPTAAPDKTPKPQPLRDTTPQAAVKVDAASPWGASPSATSSAPSFTALPSGAVAARSSAP